MIVRQLLSRGSRRTLAAANCRAWLHTPTTEGEPSPDSSLYETFPSATPFRSPPLQVDVPKERTVAENFHAIKKQRKQSTQLGSTIGSHYQPHTLLTHPPSPQDITLELLLASQSHLGHSTSLWHPANSRYIFGIRQGIHIISLDVTAAHLRRACKIVSEVAERGGLILFVGTRGGQDRCVVNAARLAGGCHLFERWIPGSITNGQQILGQCGLKVVDENDRELQGFEHQLVDRAALKPDLVVCLNPLENYVLLHECGLNNIPTIGIIDTDANPTWVTYPIPANDDSPRCVHVIAGVLGKAGEQGRIRRREKAEKGELTVMSTRGLHRRDPSKSEATESIDPTSEPDCTLVESELTSGILRNIPRIGFAVMVDGSKQPGEELTKESIPQSPRSIDESRFPSSSLRLGHMSNSASPHRQSFSESLRGVPPSPRSQRHPSLTQAGVQELLNNPPVSTPADPAFVGRDWRTIQVGELVNAADLRFVELDTGVEAATNLLVESEVPVLLIRETPTSRSAIGTFDYSDLNAYFLLVVGLVHPDEDHLHSFQELVKKGRGGNKVPLKDVKDLGNKEPFVTLPHRANLTKAVEVFGGGVHRIVVVKEGTDDVIGVLSQLRLVKFLWENRQSFPVIDRLYPQQLKELGVGSQHVISINGDRPLGEALELMNKEGITSLAVVDNQYNVVGNISTVDVKLLTKSSQVHLLKSSCIHFISVILSTRGMDDGQDSFPVFHVNPYSTLAHTVAKLVATKSHRMWIVESPSPSSSGPPTPASQPAVLTGLHTQSLPPTTLQSPSPPFAMTPSPSISAASLPGLRMSGKLSGVVSLTDVLNLSARASGLSPNDPNETRKQRRRSSSSSMRPSLDSGRSSSADIRMRP